MQDTEFDRLCEDFPLSERWTRPSLLRHVTRIGKTEIRLIGLSATETGGQCVTGSAGGLEESTLERAYFELLERTSIVEAISAGAVTVAVLDPEGRLEGTICMNEVFAESPDPQQWTYARSNGVAAGRDWKSAAHRAELELHERDRSLRSWYGEGVPHRIELPRHMVPESLDEYFEFEAYLLGGRERAAQTVVVSALLGLPREESRPLMFGFGSRMGEVESLTAAVTESLQRLGFLWDEAIPSQVPIFTPTPDFHLDYFLYPPNHAKLRAWLRGEHAAFHGLLPELTTGQSVRRFVDVTPRALHSKLVVVKALPAGELPLTFGYGHPALRRAPPEQLAIHPIA